MLPTRLNQFPTRFGHGDDLMSQIGKHVHEIVAHVLFVIGNNNPKCSRHGLAFGNMIVISSPWPGGESALMTPPWASTMRRLIAIPKPVPRVLVVKKGSKIRWLAPVKPRSIVADHQFYRRQRAANPLTPHHLELNLVRARGVKIFRQGVLQNIAKHLTNGVARPRIPCQSAWTIPAEQWSWLERGEHSGGRSPGDHGRRSGFARLSLATLLLVSGASPGSTSAILLLVQFPRTQPQPSLCTASVDRFDRRCDDGTAA